MIIIFSAIIFLFILFVLSKDDFLFMRKNVSLRTIFDIAFIAGIIGIFFSRLVYVFMHPSSAYLNPLVFFVIPYFPGLSASGFIFGILLALYLLTVRRKLPMGKLYDIFSLALTASSGFLFLGFSVEQLLMKHFFLAGVYGVCFVILLFVFNVLKKISLDGSLKDGSIAIGGIFTVSLLSLVSQAVLLSFKSIPKEFPYFLFLFAILLVSFFIKLVKKTGDKL